MTNANLTLKIFGQENCNPCRVIKAVIDGERSDIESLGVTIEHVDLTKGVRDDREELLAKYGIMSTPVTVIERSNGEAVTTWRGMFNMTELFETLKDVTK